MTQLIGCNTADFKGLDSTPGLRARGARADKPIYVHVRVRQYADVLPSVRQSDSGNFDLGRMPVGTVLDCYV